MRRGVLGAVANGAGFSSHLAGKSAIEQHWPVGQWRHRCRSANGMVAVCSGLLPRVYVSDDGGVPV